MAREFKQPQAFEETPRPLIHLQPVNSNQVAAIGYEEETKTLAVAFHRSQAIYHYPNVEPETFVAMKTAESIGGYFGQHIKDLPFKKYRPETVQA